MGRKDDLKLAGAKAEGRRERVKEVSKLSQTEGSRFFPSALASSVSKKETSKKYSANRDRVISVLREALKDKDVQVRCTAAQVLMQLGTSAPDVTPDLLEVLNKGSAFEKSAAASALGQ
jgi:HEAT repeat protein